MPTIDGSYYADAATLASIETITAAMAAAEDVRIDLKADLSTNQIYNYRPANAAALAALVASGRLGDLAFQVDTGVLYRHNGTTYVAWESGWTAYTPTLTNFTIGTGGGASNAAFYRYQGGRVQVKGSAKLGSSGASVGGTVNITLPSGINRAALNHNWQGYKGNATFYDDNTAVNYIGFVAANNNSVTGVTLLTSGAAGVRTPTGAAAPFTWAAADMISYDFEYDPA